MKKSSFGEINKKLLIGGGIGGVVFLIIVIAMYYFYKKSSFGKGGDTKVCKPGEQPTYTGGFIGIGKKASCTLARTR